MLIEIIDETEEYVIQKVYKLGNKVPEWNKTARKDWINYLEIPPINYAAIQTLSGCDLDTCMLKDENSFSCKCGARGHRGIKGPSGTIT